MKVLNVLPDQRFGGPQSRVLQVAARLRFEGFETVVAMPRGEPTSAGMFAHAGLPVCELDLVRPRQTFSPGPHLRYAASFWPNVGQLRSIIRSHAVDVVHVNGAISLQGPIAARLEGVPTVWHLNDAGIPAVARAASPPTVRRLATVVAVSSHGVARYYFGDRVERYDPVVLYPPVDLCRFNSNVSGAGVRAELGLPASVPVVGMVANLNPGKGIEYLVQALPKIKEQVPGVRALIVGASLSTREGYGSHLLRMCSALGVAEDVIFAGHRQDVPCALAAMTVYVQASKVEAVGMAAMEASASGLPVVATAVGGVPEVVEDGVSGVLVEPRSPAAIAKAVTELLADPERCRSMGLRGSEKMGSQFSLERCAMEHRRVYERAATSWTGSCR